MRKLIGTLMIPILIIAGVGFYRGWFGVSAFDQPGQTNVEITVDKEKIRQDAEAASEKAREKARELTEKADSVEETPEETPVE